jgi:hypothetical protein
MRMRVDIVDDQDEGAELDLAGVRVLLEALSIRVRRLERRMSDLEPETATAIESSAAAPSSNEPNILDAFSDTLDALGIGTDH